MVVSRKGSRRAILRQGIAMETAFRHHAARQLRCRRYGFCDARRHRIASESEAGVRGRGRRGAARSSEEKISRRAYLSGLAGNAAQETGPTQPCPRSPPPPPLPPPPPPLP